MNLFTLVAKLTLDKSEYSNSMNEAGNEAESFGERASDGINKAKLAFAGIVTVGSAVIGATKKVAEHGDEIDKMSQKMNMSAEAYQEWAHILEHSGSSINSLQPSMKTLANAVETGSDAFEKLGLNLDDLKSMSQEDIFAETIKALQNVESETERTYIASQLLGRGATELGPLLNTSAEDVEDMRKKLHEMGGVMSNEAVKNSAAFEDALTDLKAGFSGAGNALFSELLPYLTDFMNGISDWIADGGFEKLIDLFEKLVPLITGATTAFVAYKSATAISAVIDGLTKATEAQTAAQALLNAVMNANPFVLVATLIAGLVAAMVTLYNTNESFRNKVNEVWSTITIVFTNVKDTIVNALTTAWNTVEEKTNAIRESFRSKFEEAKTIVSNAIDYIKGLFNFTWSLPSLKLPHFSVSGGFGLNPPSVPSFSVDWYKRAYTDPIMFTSPTVIPTIAGMKGFGDGAGNEVVLSEAKLREIAGGNGMTFVQNIYAPTELSPSEIERQTRNANREMILAIKGVR